MPYCKCKRTTSLFLLLLFVLAPSVFSQRILNSPVYKSEESGSEDLYYIKHSSTGLYLDGSERIVTAKRFTGYPEQVWYVDCDSDGRCPITNKATGNVLDVENAHSGIARHAHVVTTASHGGDHQEWFLVTDGKIRNAARRMYIELDGNYHAAMGSRSRFNRNQVFEVIDYDPSTRPGSPCGGTCPVGR